MKKYILSVILLVLLLMPTALATGEVKINDFNASVLSGKVPLHDYFTGNVSGNVSKWVWLFHNEQTNVTTRSNANITAVHNFQIPGVYDVKLKVFGLNDTGIMTNDMLEKKGYINATA